MIFAARTDFGERESAYGAALRSARRRDGFLDLSATNPTRCGLDLDAERLLAPLSGREVLHYRADPLGMPAAREAVAAFYREAGAQAVTPERLLLTSSTSEAYSYLLRLFCEPGDNILVPSPSYPLFDLLARLHDVELAHYPLVYHDGWQIDPDALSRAVTPRTRAVVAIHPNNPTGHYCGPADVDALTAVAQRHALPLIVDEVFREYPVEGVARQSFAAIEARVPTFVLGGLSKLLAAPQMKLAWTAVCGPAALADEAMHRLEIIADTFLSVSTPPQVALPAWLRERAAIQQTILDRVRCNLRQLDEALAGSALSRLRVEGGWAAVVRVPALEPDTDLAVRLLRDHAIAVHPGSFYGFPQRGWLVLSLLPEPRAFAAGVQRLLGQF